MKKVFSFIFLILEFSFINSLEDNENGKRIPTCKRPKGFIGDSRISGCRKFVCVRKGKRAYWAESFARTHCCSYEHDPYEIGQNISQVETGDSCTVVTLQCGGRVGQPRIQTIIDVKECSQSSWQHYIDSLSITESFEFVRTVHSHILERLEKRKCLNDSALPTTVSTSESNLTTTTDLTTTTTSNTTTPACPANNCDSCVSTTTKSPSSSSDSELLFVGPGYSRVWSEILSLPSLVPANCSVSTKIIPKGIYGYVATVVSHGIFLCGGKNWDTGVYYKRCFLLTNAGFWLSSPPLASMSTKRTYAAAVSFDGGWWVIGGYQSSGGAVASSEVYFEQNNTWVPSVDYPEAVYGHCAVELNKTHVFFASGYSKTCYIYSKEGGFVKQKNMKKMRRYHACALYEDKVFVVGGESGEKSVEYFSLGLLSWENSLSVAPSLPISGSKGDLLVLGGSLTYFSIYKKIFKLVKKVWSSFTRYEWQELGELRKSKEGFKVLKWRVNCTAWDLEQGK